MPESYALEFRRRVIELRRGGRPARVIAQELEVSEATVNRWVAQEEIDLGERPGVRSREHIELSRARARIKELEGELELTRKASALFGGCCVKGCCPAGLHRGRDCRCRQPPAQIPACTASAPGSSLGC